MNQELFNLWSIIIAVLSLLITLVGLYAVYVQISKLRNAAWSNTHAKLCDQSLELLRFFNETPETYDYFYYQKPLADDAPNRVTILYAAEALVNFMEHIILQKENLPDKQWEVWNRFIHTTFKTSVVVSNFIHDNRDWYSPDFLAIADACRVLYRS